MRRPLFGIALQVMASFVVSAAVPAHAAIIYDNGGPTGGGLEATQWIQASDFSLAVDATLTDIHFWTIEFSSAPGYQGSVYYWIYANDPVADTPDETNIRREGLLNPSRSFLAPSTTPGQDFYSYDMIVAPLNLAAGTYWLALHNGPLSTTFRAEWYWAATDDKTSTFEALEDIAPFDGGWQGASRQEHAFYLTGPQAVPEPVGLSLIAIGLAMAARRHLQQRR